MKTLWKIGGSILICLVILLAILRVTGLEPRDRTPGLWIKGDPVSTPVDDWSYTDQIETIKLQTKTWYLLPHSVTTFCVSYNGQLYLTSVYPAGVQYPHGRHWNENVARDPHVRLKIGDKVFDRTLSVVTDPAEKEGVIQNKRKKYPKQVIAKDATINVFHVMPS